ncbi:hypothetical protein HAN01_23630, partial [Escherichia coli]|nr:hypothetical protein [Escherichia coli]
MKLNIFTKSMIGMGLVCSALPALAMEAWNNQQGGGSDSNLLIVFYVQIMPDDLVMQLH